MKLFFIKSKSFLAYTFKVQTTGKT